MHVYNAYVWIPSPQGSDAWHGDVSAALVSRERWPGAARTLPLPAALHLVSRTGPHGSVGCYPSTHRQCMRPGTLGTGHARQWWKYFHTELELFIYFLLCTHFLYYFVPLTHTETHTTMPVLICYRFPHGFHFWRTSTSVCWYFLLEEPGNIDMEKRYK